MNDLNPNTIMTNGPELRFDQKISVLQEQLANAEAVVIGAGSGLSTAAGYTYSGERFEKYFADFERKYGIRDMYSGGFYPYKKRLFYFNVFKDSDREIYWKILYPVSTNARTGQYQR